MQIDYMDHYATYSTLSAHMANGSIQIYSTYNHINLIDLYLNYDY
jgi:hypothetical protein